jgi:hypothetical protein
MLKNEAAFHELRSRGASDGTIELQEQKRADRRQTGQVVTTPDSRRQETSGMRGK